MKYFPVFAFTAVVWAQSAAPPASAPPAAAPPAAPQTQAPNHVVEHFDLGAHMAAAVTPDTVVATFDNDKKLTAGLLNAFLAAMPPNMAQAAQHDRKGFVQQFAMMEHLAEMAEKAKLDQVSPTREAIAFNRLYLLMNAQLHEVLNGLTVPAADVQKFYDEKKERFKQVRVKAIYIPFSDQPAAPNEPKKLTPAEAQAKIAKLRADIAGGADFVKLVKENSQDEISRTKDGDFGVMHSTDNLPQSIRTAVFALKAGEVSQPVKEPNGFYLFRAEEVTTEPLADVQETIVSELRQAEFKMWMDNLQKDIHLKIENEGFFVQSGGPAPAGK